MNRKKLIEKEIGEKLREIFENMGRKYYIGSRGKNPKLSEKGSEFVLFTEQDMVIEM